MNTTLECRFLFARVWKGSVLSVIFALRSTWHMMMRRDLWTILLAECQESEDRKEQTSDANESKDRSCKQKKPPLANQGAKEPVQFARKKKLSVYV